jgi:2-aminoadipate transaminase
VTVETQAPPWYELLARGIHGAGGGNEISSFIGHAGDQDVITFSGGFPAPETFPKTALLELFPRVVNDPAALQYAPTAGLPGFRDWFAGWLEEHDGQRPADGELLMTSGGMEGLALLSHCLLDPGDLVVAEGPTFMGALLAIRHVQCQVEAVPLDKDGFDVAAMERLLRRPGGQRPKFVYLIPDYQNPTGHSLSVERRHALVALARRYGFLIVEDVAYREIGFDGVRRPSLRSLAPDVVIQLGTFAKTFSPGIRMGWITAPAALTTHLVRAKQYTDQCVSALGQRLLEEYGRSGDFDRGIAASREFYQKRCAAIVDALTEYLPPEVTFTRPGGGFFTWLTAPEPVDVAALQPAARRARVVFMAGHTFYPDGRGANQLRLAYSKVPPEQIAVGVRRLGEILTQNR